MTCSACPHPSDGLGVWASGESLIFSAARLAGQRAIAADPVRPVCLPVVATCYTLYYENRIIY